MTPGRCATRRRGRARRRGRRAEHQIEVMLDDQDRDFAAQAGEGVEHFLHHDGRQPLEGLIERQDSDGAGERTRNRDHLLLSAGELVGLGGELVADAREVLVDPFALPPHPGAAAAGRCAQTQVLVHAQPGEQAPALWHQAHAQPGDLLGRHAADGAALQLHAAAHRRDQAQDALEGGGFARAVASQQSNDLIRQHVEGHVAQDVALSVQGVDGLDAQDRRASRFVGRCARLRVGLAAANVDALHFRVAAHGLRVALHQHLALVHHGDALRDGKDAIDVVLHQQHGHVAGESLDQDR